jgi:septal ring factor EnvC (AmiA/AmiB activator)
MSTFAKIMVVVNFVLAIAFLAAAGTLYGSAESWQRKWTSLDTEKKSEIASLEGQLKARGEELATARTERASLETRTAAAEAVQKTLTESNANLMREIQTKNAEIAKHQSAVTDLTNSVKEQTQRNETLSNQLAQATADKNSVSDQAKTLEENLARETQAREAAEKQVAALEGTNKTMTDRLDSVSVELAAYKKAHGPLAIGTVMAPVHGVVQRASARDDIYVISVGSKDKVEVGYEFTVSRGDHYVSTIVVDAVYANHAAAHTKPGMKKLDVMEGDAVATPTGL